MSVIPGVADYRPILMNTSANNKTGHLTPLLTSSIFAVLLLVVRTRAGRTLRTGLSSAYFRAFNQDLDRKFGRHWFRAVANYRLFDRVVEGFS
ncbi:MAG: hypothetical protein GY703_12380 [Gammaproteobacteria bacterium]|nr:hypothetical protein [Gammaproteobacteria bacterium]